MGMGNFAFGFAVGFGSGMAFRALSERDFEPAKQVMRTTVGMAQRFGDVALDTFGRLRESAEDVAAHLRAERVRLMNGGETRPAKKARSRRSASASRARARTAAQPRARVLNA